jgi:hypothetical protein
MKIFPKISAQRKVKIAYCPYVTGCIGFFLGFGSTIFFGFGYGSYTINLTKKMLQKKKIYFFLFKICDLSQ